MDSPVNGGISCLPRSGVQIWLHQLSELCFELHQLGLLWQHSPLEHWKEFPGLFANLGHGGDGNNNISSADATTPALQHLQGVP